MSIILPRPGHNWEEWNEESRNHWLQIHIAREPGFCTGKTFQELPFPYGSKEERPGYWNLKRFGCPKCGYIMAASLDILRTVPREQIFPPRHPFTIPRYTQEGKQAVVQSGGLLPACYLYRAETFSG